MGKKIKISLLKILIKKITLFEKFQQNKLLCDVCYTEIKIYENKKINRSNRKYYTKKWILIQFGKKN